MANWWQLLFRPRGQGEPRALPLPEERHLPGATEIAGYGNGGFRFAGMSHRGAILCLPSGVFAWDAAAPDQITPESLARVVAEKAGIETLIIGTGRTLVFPPPGVTAALRRHGIVTECVATGSAVRMYNVMLGEKRAVACALLAVEQA